MSPGSLGCSVHAQPLALAVLMAFSMPSSRLWWCANTRNLMSDSSRSCSVVQVWHDIHKTWRVRDSSPSTRVMCQQ